MVERRMLVGAHGRLDGTGLWFHRPVNNSRDAGVNHCAHAHLTRFDRHIHRGAGQAVVAHPLGRGAKGDDFGVRRRIRCTDWLITARAEDFVVQDDNGSDWNFAAQTRVARLFERHPHESFISLDGHDPQAEQLRAKLNI
jgi:hypothetical protein